METHWKWALDFFRRVPYNGEKRRGFSVNKTRLVLFYSWSGNTRRAARLLAERGADAIAFASCIGKGTPIGYPCPFFRKMLELVKQELPEGAKVFEYTH